jgi:hypothetical protein
MTLMSIDGCRGGWVIATADERLERISFEIAADLAEILGAADFVMESPGEDLQTAPLKPPVAGFDTTDSGPAGPPRGRRFSRSRPARGALDEAAKAAKPLGLPSR